MELLFETQLGGGTDINRALAYCQQVITRPTQTILVLITDLCEGGDAAEMIKRAAAIFSTVLPNEMLYNVGLKTG